MLTVTSPFDDSKIGEIPMNSAADLEQFLQQASNVLKTNPLAAHQRIKILENAKELMKIRREELIETACAEGGKPYNDSAVEVDRAINGVQLAINAIHELKGENIPMGLTAASEGRLAFSVKEPIGVVAAISAFNHPVNLIVHQVFTAIAAGCSVVVKPSLTTPFSCLLLAEILNQAGLPNHYCQVFIAKDDLAERLATDPRVSFLTFIGSAKVGWYLRSKIAPGTRCALEHGGVAPVIVEEDADLHELIPALTKGAFYHAGQVCVSVQKVFIHENIAHDLIAALAEKACNIIVGNPLDKNTEVGPLISTKEVGRVDEWVQNAIHEGAQLICGGKKLSESCYAPTILLNPNRDSKVSRLEIFGPVMCIYTYQSIDLAIEEANSLNFHFQAAIFTQNINTGLSAIKKINAAAVMINDHTAFRVDWMPFGGRDESGLGIGGISHSINDMSKEKLIVIKSSAL